MSIAKGTHFPLWSATTPQPWTTTQSQSYASLDTRMEQMVCLLTEPSPWGQLCSWLTVSPSCSQPRHTYLKWSWWRLSRSVHLLLRLLHIVRNHLTVLRNVTSYFMLSSHDQIHSNFRALPFVFIGYGDFVSPIYRMGKMSPICTWKTIYTL